MIPVTKPFLPPKAEYDKLISEIWSRNWLTNNGPVVNQLELSLKESLKVAHLGLVLNGTIALQMLFRALELKGKFITTPFSYIATTSAGVWEGLTPVFVDIDKDTFNIDPNKIEERIDDEVCCILATHVFGNPCDVEALEKIGKKYGVPVIYDAAHAFGVTFKGVSILNYGDASTLSFHATKLYHMIEGGAVITKDPEVMRRVALLRNFGHKGETFEGVGINGKCSEVHAAMGMVNLNYVGEIIERRRVLSKKYNQIFGANKVDLKRQQLVSEEEYNYAYYPIVLKDEETVAKVVKVLEGNHVYPRRYFYPSLNEVPYVEDVQMPVSEDIAKRILCLPLYHELTLTDIEFITRLIIRTLKYD